MNEANQDLQLIEQFAKENSRPYFVLNTLEEYLEKIKSLDYKFRGIICCFENNSVTSISFRRLYNQDFSFLKELKNLTTLDLSHNELTDVSFLKELKNLTTLNLNCNRLTDVSFLKELKNLTKLDLRYNKLTDVSFLKDLDGIFDVNLENNPIINPPK